MRTICFNLAVLITVLVIVLTITKEDFSLCNGNKKPKGFFERLLDFLNSLFYPRKKEKKDKKDSSFTVPVDQRNELMHDSKNGKKYYWSWQ